MLFDEENEDEFIDVDELEEVQAEVLAPNELLSARHQHEIVSHVEIEKRLLDMAASSRMPHALIFSGVPGIGKATMAFRFARYLFKYKTEPQDAGLFGGFDTAPAAAPANSLAVSASDQIFQQVASGGYPDLLTVERPVDDKGKPKNHDLDEVRAITAFFRRTASVDGGWRVAIVDDSDSMNWHAQNALLKILEEPPEKSLLILITHRLGAMLPTILSRSSVIHFNPLPDEEIKNFLNKYSPIAAGISQNRIIGMAAGSIGRALYYGDSSRLTVIEQALALLEKWPNLDWAEVQSFADAVGSKTADNNAQEAFRDSLLWAINSLVRVKSIAGPLPDGLAERHFYSMQDSLTLGDLLEMAAALQRHFDLVQTGSLDKRYMVMGAYSIICP